MPPEERGGSAPARAGHAARLRRSGCLRGQAEMLPSAAGLGGCPGTRAAPGPKHASGGRTPAARPRRAAPTPRQGLQSAGGPATGGPADEDAGGPPPDLHGGPRGGNHIGGGIVGGLPLGAHLPWAHEATRPPSRTQAKGMACSTQQRLAHAGIRHTRTRVGILLGSIPGGPSNRPRGPDQNLPVLPPKQAPRENTCGGRVPRGH